MLSAAPGILVSAHFFVWFVAQTDRVRSRRTQTRSAGLTMDVIVIATSREDVASVGGATSVFERRGSCGGARLRRVSAVTRQAPEFTHGVSCCGARASTFRA
jgi:hypothetical protein